MSKINKAVPNIMNVKSTEAARIFFTKGSRAYKITKHDSARIYLLFFFLMLICLIWKHILILNTRTVGKHTQAGLNIMVEKHW